MEGFPFYSFNSYKFISCMYERVSIPLEKFFCYDKLWKSGEECLMSMSVEKNKKKDI